MINIFLLTMIVIMVLFGIFTYQQESFTNYNYITLSQIRNRFRHLIFILGINPNNITEEHLFTIIKTYKHLFPRIKLSKKYITQIFRKLDLDNKGSIDYKTVSYLYFYKNNYIDKDIYQYNKIQESMKESKVNNHYIPFNGNKLTNHYESINYKSINKNKSKNNKSTVIPYHYDAYPNVIPIKPFPQQLLKTNKCSREYKLCFSNDKNIIYYGLNNLK